MAGSSVTQAVVLVEVDFSGTAPNQVGTIASSSTQFTIKNSAVDFSSVTVGAIGGVSSTANWVYDGTGTAAANTDLHTASTFGAPTRFDLALGTAVADQSYTITSVEVDIRASANDVTWEFGYRKASDNSTVLVGSQTISAQTGANPISTYTINLTGENLIATDSSMTWVTSGTGNLRWNFFEPTATGNDNFQVDAIRVIGTVVPEPGAVLLGSFGLLALLRRRR